jgi:hypothetical protein
MTIAGARIALKDAVLVQSAQSWLKRGEPFEALRELEQLPRRERAKNSQVKQRRNPASSACAVLAFFLIPAPEPLHELREGIGNPC